MYLLANEGYDGCVIELQVCEDVQQETVRKQGPVWLVTIHPLLQAAPPLYTIRMSGSSSSSSSSRSRSSSSRRTRRRKGRSSSSSMEMDNRSIDTK